MRPAGHAGRTRSVFCESTVARRRPVHFTLGESGATPNGEAWIAREAGVGEREAAQPEGRPCSWHNPRVPASSAQPRLDLSGAFGVTRHTSWRLLS